MEEKTELMLVAEDVLDMIRKEMGSIMLQIGPTELSEYEKGMAAGKVKTLEMFAVYFRELSRKKAGMT